VSFADLIGAAMRTCPLATLIEIKAYLRFLAFRLPLARVCALQSEYPRRKENP